MAGLDPAIVFAGHGKDAVVSPWHDEEVRASQRPEKRHQRRALILRRVTKRFLRRFRLAAMPEDRFRKSSGAAVVKQVIVAVHRGNEA